MFFKYLKHAMFTASGLALAAVLALGVSGNAPKDDKKPVDKPAEKQAEKKAEKKKAPAPPNVSAEDMPGYLQNMSVTIHADSSQGSGVIKTRDGVNYVLTAGHVVAHLRKTRTVIDPKTGTPKVVVKFDDAKVVKEIYDDDHRSVGRLVMDAEVLRYSDADNGDDLALLRLRKKGFVKASAHFDTKGIVPVGTDLLHVGSLLGQQGSNSLTSGIVSQHGRVLHGVVFDQSTCAAFPGSSGGGVFRKKDGAYVGMIVRGAGETFNLYVPMRRIQKWAERVGVQFIFDESVDVPDEKSLRKTPIEDTVAPSGNSCDRQPKQPVTETQFKFLIRTIDRPKSNKITIEW